MIASTSRAVIPDNVPTELSAAMAQLNAEVETLSTIRLPNCGYLGREAPYRRQVTEVVAGLDDLQRRALLVVVLARWLDGSGRPQFMDGDSMAEFILSALRRRNLGWTADQLIWLAQFLESNTPALGRAVSLTAQIVADGLDRCPDAADRVADVASRLADKLDADRRADSWKELGYGDLSPLIARFSAFARSGGIPPHLLDDQDSFGARVRAPLCEALPEPSVVRLLLLCSSYGAGTTPSARWRRRVDVAVLDSPELLTGAQILASTIVGQPEPVPDEYGWAYHWIGAATETLIRAAIWIVLDHAEPAVAVGLIRDAGAYCAQSARTPGLGVRSLKITNAAIAALSEGGLDVVQVDQPGLSAAALATVRHRAANRAITIAIDKSLSAIAARHEMDAQTLSEGSIPRFGLDREGRLERKVASYTAIIEIDGGTGGSAGLCWLNASGRQLTGTPAAVRTADPVAVAELRRIVRDVRKTVPAQRDRLDQLMATRRTWTVESWIRDYLEHPILGALAGSLIWVVDDPQTPGRRLSGLPRRAGESWTVLDREGVAHPVPVAGATVGLWHPLGRSLDEILAWRTAVTADQVHQPFKQAHREIYLLTPAESETDTYSNRFAAHILRYRQMAALMRARDWRPPQLGEWDMGDDGDAIRVFGGVRALFRVEMVEHDGGPDPTAVELCSSDHVRFESADTDGSWKPMPLAQVDTLVFSEAMRDVDLFVGVTSIATDATWTTDRTDHRDYWERTSFGALSETAASRREALEQLLPRTRLADRARIHGRFVVVEGRLRTYRIHIGSGNILMEPDNSYLCIVPKRAHPEDIYLPFEGDGRLSVIVSKMFLLADDDKITDPTITWQLDASSRR